MNSNYAKDSKYSPRTSVLRVSEFHSPLEADSSKSRSDYSRTEVSPRLRGSGVRGLLNPPEDDLNEPYKELHEAQTSSARILDPSASTYALHVTLKNMKERYQNLQKKIAVLEEENGRLMQGKSELFGEIGKMQESSIKLREKNLMLNQEVHSQHTESCSLKDRYTDLTEENLKLCTQLSKVKLDRRRIQRQFDCIYKDNEKLRDSLSQAVTQCRGISSMPEEYLKEWERVAKSANYTGTQDSDTGVILDDKLSIPNKIIQSYKTKIVPSLDELYSFDEIEQMHENMENLDHEIYLPDPNDDPHSFSSLEKLTDGMAKITELLRKQKDDLIQIHPLIVSCKAKEISSHNKSANEDENRYCTGRLATYGSGLRTSHLLSGSSSSGELEHFLNESLRDNETLVHKEPENKPSPFDWRNVQIDSDTNEHSRGMKDISTSPDVPLASRVASDIYTSQRFPSSNDEDDDKKCPMCYLIFPVDIPMEDFIQHVAGHFEQESGFQVMS